MEIGVKYVQENVQRSRRYSASIKNKGGQAARRLSDYGLNTDRMIDLIATAKLDYTFGLFFNYGWL